MSYNSEELMNRWRREGLCEPVIKLRLEVLDFVEEILDLFPDRETTILDDVVLDEG